MSSKIIAITGKNGAGKGTIVDHLKKDYGFKHFSFRDYFTQELQRRNKEVNRDTMREIANELRKEYGNDYCKKLLEQVYASGENYVIESIRCLSEIDFLETQPNTFLFGVDADRKLRYERSYERASDTDKVSYEKFCELEQLESLSNDPMKQNLILCFERVPEAFRFTNNGALEELHAQIDETMKFIDMSVRV